MSAPSVQDRLDAVEKRLQTLDQTIGSYVEPYRGREDSIVQQLERIEDIIQSLNGFRDLAAKLTTVEKRLNASQGGVSQNDGSQGDIVRPATPPMSSPMSVPADIESENFKSQIKELEIRLKQSEDERKQTQSLFEDAHADLQQWKAEFDKATAAHKDIEMLLKDKIESERTINRNLFKKVQDMKGSIRVMCRIRPAPDAAEDELVNFGPRERGEFSDAWGKIRIPTERKTAMGTIVNETKSFSFERIFGPEETNNDIFDEISDLVQYALDGQKVGIFAYGQTGSGKTYTLSHKDLQDGTSDGIIPRTLASIFEAAGAASDRYKYAISLSVLEIYTNNIYDLLQAPVDHQKVETRLDQATIVPLNSLSAAEELIDDAIQIRTSSSTEKNVNSSRSHLILTFRVTQESRAEAGHIVEGQLKLVDLAGSERSAATGLEGQQLQEGILINRSLLSLNKAITALGQGAAVAYDTALTRALRPCLSHDSKTLMFVMVSPFKRDLVVSLQTLDKGQEATKAKLASSARADARRTSTASGSGGGGGSGSGLNPSPSSLRYPASTGRNTYPDSGRGTPASAARKTAASAARGAASGRARGSVPTPPVRGARPGQGSRGVTPARRGPSS
ncbi:P-loop containing nucleoside triphosphate hydrolase protein [Hypoxylon sp. FL1284]|nr:P-loop containing nucleoside triphosphate hydrolase protein [Hypoxylon sp. FL1284]